MRTRALSSATIASLAGACGMLLCACDGPSSIFAPAGPPARSLAWLGGTVMVLFCVAIVVLAFLVVAGATRRRGTLADHAPADAKGGTRWILVGGLLVPGVVFGTLLVVTLVEVSRSPLQYGGQYKPDVRLVGRQWWWEVQYLGRTPDRNVTTANELHVPIGWPVEIELESRDVIHSFWVPALHGKVDLVPGHPNHIRILADRPGRYDGECAEYCGAEHAQMRFRVVAEPLEEYERWRAHEAAPAAEPFDAEAATGKELFETRACGVCHTIRGTRAEASAGPDLTHVAEREGIAADSLPASRAYLEAWITHAQSLKPGAEMPNLTQLTGSELQALTHYLEQLR